MMFKMGGNKAFNNYKKERHIDPAIQMCRDAVKYEPEWEQEAAAFEPAEPEEKGRHCGFEPES